MKPEEAIIPIEANRKRWDALVDSHAKSKFYDMEGFKAGKTSLKAPELDLMGPVAGKTLLHLQCHFGQDTLSWARVGAQVTGMDISGNAIRLAESLSAELNVPSQFICCNLYDLPKHLNKEHDIIFTSYGGIPWLPDLEAWAKVIYPLLKPGGTMVLVEFHPTWMMLDFNNLEIIYSYFNRGEPYIELPEGSYVDHSNASEPVQMEECFWNHSLSEVIQNLLAQGLILERFEEYDYSAWNCFPGMAEVAPGKYMRPGKETMLPLMFGLRLRKPG